MLPAMSFVISVMFLSYFCENHFDLSTFSTALSTEKSDVFRGFFLVSTVFSVFRFFIYYVFVTFISKHVCHPIDKTVVLYYFYLKCFFNRQHIKGSVRAAALKPAWGAAPNPARDFIP